MSDDLSKKFNLVVAPPDQVTELSAEVVSDNAKKDFTQARASMVSIVDVASQAVTDLGALCSQSQDVNYYLALATMVKNGSDAASSLIKLHKQLQELEAPLANKNDTMPGQLHNHIHFPSMSTNDLKEALKTLKSND